MFLALVLFNRLITIKWSDDDGLYLKKCGGAKDFLIKSNWTFTYAGSYNTDTGKWNLNQWKIDNKKYTLNNSQIYTDANSRQKE